MLVGHQRQWGFLKKAAETSRVPHAMLFSGEGQLGKKKVAVEFIKLLNCQNKEVKIRPCQDCPSCRAIERRAHPDFIAIEPDKNLVQISQIRKLGWRLALKSSVANFKSAIIDQSHYMNQEAQSALLKTLEEPEGRSLLILVSEYPDMLLPTVLSRVHQLKFYPVRDSEIEDFIKTKKISQQEIEEIIRWAQGKPGRAIDFLEDPQKFKDYKKRASDLLEILDSDLAFSFQYAKLLAAAPEETKRTLNIWLRHLREILLTRAFSPSLPEETPSQDYSLIKLKKIIELVERIDFLLSTTNINPKLALEFLMVELKI